MAAEVPFLSPVVVPSIGGQTIEVVQIGARRCLVRLLTYVPGRPVSEERITAALIKDVGRSLAHLDLCLNQMPRSASPRCLIWSISTAVRLRPLIQTITNTTTRSLVQRAFTNFEHRTMPLLNQIRTQVTHGDFNVENVLVSPCSPKRVVGVIDFADLTIGPLINDLAVAAASYADPNDPVPDILTLIAGFVSQVSILLEEVGPLFDLICLRPAMRLAMWSAHAARFDVPLRADVARPCTTLLETLLETDARSRICGAMGG